MQMRDSSGLPGQIGATERDRVFSNSVRETLLKIETVPVNPGRMVTFSYVGLCGTMQWNVLLILWNWHSKTLLVGGIDRNGAKVQSQEVIPGIDLPFGAVGHRDSFRSSYRLGQASLRERLKRRYILPWLWSVAKCFLKILWIIAEEKRFYVCPWVERTDADGLLPPVTSGDVPTNWINTIINKSLVLVWPRETTTHVEFRSRLKVRRHIHIRATCPTRIC